MGCPFLQHQMRLTAILFLLPQEDHKKEERQDRQRDLTKLSHRFFLSRALIRKVNPTINLSFSPHSFYSWPGQFGLYSASSNLYLEHLRILLNWSTLLSYCLVRTGIPIPTLPKGTDSDSVIQPERRALAGEAGSNLFFRLLLQAYQDQSTTRERAPVFGAQSESYSSMSIVTYSNATSFLS